MRPMPGWVFVLIALAITVVLAALTPTFPWIWIVIQLTAVAGIAAMGVYAFVIEPLRRRSRH